MQLGMYAGYIQLVRAVLNQQNVDGFAGLNQQSGTVWDSSRQLGVDRYLQFCAVRSHAVNNRLQKHVGQWQYTIMWQMLQC